MDFFGFKEMGMGDMRVRITECKNSLTPATNLCHLCFTSLGAKLPGSARRSQQVFQQRKTTQWVSFYFLLPLPLLFLNLTFALISRIKKEDPLLKPRNFTQPLPFPPISPPEQIGLLVTFFAKISENEGGIAEVSLSLSPLSASFLCLQVCKIVCLAG